MRLIVLIEDIDKYWKNVKNNVIILKEVIKIKVAVISDIHGNCVALKEVLKDAEK